MPGTLHRGTTNCMALQLVVEYPPPTASVELDRVIPAQQEGYFYYYSKDEPVAAKLLAGVQRAVPRCVSESDIEMTPRHAWGNQTVWCSHRYRTALSTR